MTGPENYREAERLLAEVKTIPRRWWRAGTSQARREVLAAAQVHATLALTAATGLPNAARRGVLAAEALPPAQQEQLIRELVDAGWTDPQIAAHTRWTSYVVGRIRGRIGLRPNIDRTAGGGVA